MILTWLGHVKPVLYDYIEGKYNELHTECTTDSY